MNVIMELIGALEQECLKTREAIDALHWEIAAVDEEAGRVVTALAQYEDMVTLAIKRRSTSNILEISSARIWLAERNLELANERTRLCCKRNLLCQTQLVLIAELQKITSVIQPRTV
jgi:hypothetical protein